MPEAFDSMPIYVYEHTGDGCSRGKRFLLKQPIKEDARTACPCCGKPVERLIQPSHISTPKGNSELRDKGFAKLVRRDNGVYENVTALDHESRVWEADKPETMPDVKRRIRD
jgi:predicted nucleic acid-binding Zn ribbon protein